MHSVFQSLGEITVNNIQFKPSSDRLLDVTRRHFDCGFAEMTENQRSHCRYLSRSHISPTANLARPNLAAPEPFGRMLEACVGTKATD